MSSIVIEPGPPVEVEIVIPAPIELEIQPVGARGPKGDEGDVGAAGPQGSPGAAGTAGATGATGATGSAGPAGADGATGPAGPTGTQGPQGDPGADGAAGAAGADGAPGATGATGATGAVGAAGSNGTNGATWSQGSAVPTGGVDGDFYLRTSNDDVYQKIAGTWTVIANIKGSTGATGAAGSNGTNGSSWSQGSGAPSGGVDGDFYLRTSNDDVYQKIAGTWTVIANIKGSTGATGATGSTGSTGSTGAAGQGVPTGGTTDQVLAKVNATDYNTYWRAIGAPASHASSHVAAGSDPLSLDDSQVAPVIPNDQTGTTYTFVLADKHRLVTASNAAAQTFTIPLNSVVAYPLGTVLQLYWKGVGQPTWAITATGTLRIPRGGKVAVQYGLSSATKIGTDEWVVAGDVAV